METIDAKHTPECRPLTEWPGYEVQADGKVFSLHNWRGYGRRELVQMPNNDGYAIVRLCRDGIRKPMAVHKLIAMAFLPDRPSPRHQIRHIDGSRNNSSISNLCWGTPKDNAKDRELHGRTSRGYRHSIAIRAGLEACRG